MLNYNKNLHRASREISLNRIEDWGEPFSQVKVQEPVAKDKWKRVGEGGIIYTFIDRNTRSFI